MKEFVSAFQISKTIVFEVEYYTLWNNESPHFTTSAAQFCRSKKDYTRCGQAQKALLNPETVARAFFDKWDRLHLHDLNPEEYADLQNDLENLKENYNFIFRELDENSKPYNPSFRFRTLAEFTKQKPKRKNA